MAASNTYTINYPSAGSTVATGGPYTFTTNNTSPWITTGSGTGIGQSSLKVSGDAEIDGNLKVKGRDLVKLLEKIEDRFAIISDPDPKKLEKFKALKKAYDHYKLMEKLIGEEE